MITVEKLNDFRVYRNGNSLQGVADIELPNLEPMMETVSGAGIAGDYESANVGHYGSMKLSLKWRSITDDYLGTIIPNSITFDCRGAIQVKDASTRQTKMIAVRVLAQGEPSNSELGKMEKGALMESSTEIEVTYLKVEYDGVTRIEIDKLNYKAVFNGVDYLADVRKALGL